MAHTRIVLVRPELAANIGGAARAIANTGLTGLDLVAPGDWRTVETWRTAWGATGVLERARVFGELRAALDQASYVVGFSRRAQEGVTLDVREAAAEVQALPPTATVALVFGPESSGLSLDELALCGRVAAIPSHPDQPSLNLSHAVLVTAYEVFRAAPRARPRSSLATHADKERVLGLLFEGLGAIHALSEAQRGVYRRLWRGLVQRMDLTPREARGLAHMARKMARAGSPTRVVLSEPARQLGQRVVLSELHPGPGERRTSASAVTVEGPLRAERRISSSERLARGSAAPGATPEPPRPDGSSGDSAAPSARSFASGSLEPEQSNPFADVEILEDGLSIPLLKWRELLFVGALRRDGGLFVRDVARPLPAFERRDLFPADARFEIRECGERVELRRR